MRSSKITNTSRNGISASRFLASWKLTTSHFLVQLSGIVMQLSSRRSWKMRTGNLAINLSSKIRIGDLVVQKLVRGLFEEWEGENWQWVCLCLMSAAGGGPHCIPNERINAQASQIPYRRPSGDSLAHRHEHFGWGETARWSVLKLCYQGTSFCLPAPQIALHTTGILLSRQFLSSNSPDTPRAQIVLPSLRIFRVLELYYQLIHTHIDRDSYIQRYKYTHRNPHTSSTHSTQHFTLNK